VNHEAWAIPYGDLITLLLAFFVVMYAISSVNEGKYRAVSASLTAAFNGVPRTPVPVQVGELPVQSEGQRPDVDLLPPPQPQELKTSPDAAPDSAGEAAGLEAMADDLQKALADLINAKVIAVRETPYWLEIEIQTDLLFASGTAQLSPSASVILTRLGKVLGRFPNPIRVEGHTDNLPINTPAFPSNWELSAARAASVVHLLMRSGVAPERLAVIGLGEYRPVAENSEAAGRNRNRRVQLIIPARNANMPIVREALIPVPAPATAKGNKT
jgi:chemotaxis protein MotB